MAAIERSGPQTGPADLGAESGDAASIAEQLKSRTQGVRLLPLVYKSHSLVTIVIAEHRTFNYAKPSAILFTVTYLVLTIGLAVLGLVRALS